MAKKERVSINQDWEKNLRAGVSVLEMGQGKGHDEQHQSYLSCRSFDKIDIKKTVDGTTMNGDIAIGALILPSLLAISYVNRTLQK